MNLLPQSAITQYNPYDLLRVYTYYRTLLGSVLLLMFQGQFAAKALGTDNPELFFYTSLIYTGINFVTLVMMWRLSYAPSQRKLFSSLFIDIIAIALLMHASGGAVSGLGYLLLVAIAAGGMMLRERIAILLAAITTIIVVSEGLYRFFLITADNKLMFASGSLGALAFVTTLVFQYLTKKIRVSTEEAQAQAKHAAHLQKLAQLIVERMRTGIVVLNQEQEIELFNQSAINMLGLNGRTQQKIALADIAPLKEKLASWQEQRKDHSPLLKLQTTTNTELKVNFAHLEQNNSNETLIFLEDVRALHQQAQQLKLASLGRLTASIAHEIRNPLGAISHASQLLGESTNLAADDQRLLDIINNHSKRVNQIIENILQLSRRRAANPERICLNEWLTAFIADYKTSKSDGHQIHISLLQKTLGDSPITDEQNTAKKRNTNTKLDIEAKFDVSQLQQVLTNLFDNGIRYSKSNTGKASLLIEIGIDAHQQQPYIRIIDYGVGIPEQNTKHLFEPFFTTESTGSGLGLFICKELCEANQANIAYMRTSAGESCFHLQLAHPDKAV